MKFFTRTQPFAQWTEAAHDDAAFENRMAQDDARDQFRGLQALADEFVGVAETMLGPALLDPVKSRAYARIVRYYQALLMSDQTTPPIDATDFLIWCASGLVDADEEVAA